MCERLHSLPLPPFIGEGGGSKMPRISQAPKRGSGCWLCCGKDPWVVCDPEPPLPLLCSQSVLAPTDTDPLHNQRLFHHVTKEFHCFNTVYVTSALSHPCAIKQISFTSTYWLRCKAAVCPNMAIIKNIRPPVPICYSSPLHELFYSAGLSECIWIITLKRPCLFKQNLCFHLLTFQIAATFWLACRLHNKHDRCQFFFFNFSFHKPHHDSCPYSSFCCVLQTILTFRPFF